jgi:putative addiction module CopG family antidote
MEITLTKEQESFIAEKVRSGQYANADDVMRDALQALQQLEAVESPEWEAELLAGVRSPHRPYGPDVLKRVRDAANTPR